MNSGKCWLMTTKSSDLRSGWKGGNPLEDEDEVSSGEGDSDDENEGHLRKRDRRRQPGVQKLHRRSAPWKGNVSRECRYKFFSISPAVCEDRGCPG
jgi:hypothetical protein